MVHCVYWTKALTDLNSFFSTENEFGNVYQRFSCVDFFSLETQANAHHCHNTCSTIQKIWVA